jgi:hypothetical protein
MSTISGSGRVEATSSTDNNEQCVENEPSNDTTITRNTSTSLIVAAGDSVSTKHKNNAQASEFLSLFTKVEMVSTVHQNLPLIHASSIHATREPSVSSIKSVDVPPLDVIVESSPVNEPSPVT